MKKVTFASEGCTLAGDLYYPDNFEVGKKYPALVVSGSWTTVKEQMSGLYAAELAKSGFIALAFDFRGFGDSEGEPRCYENPEMKVVDIQNAVAYLSQLPEVAHEQIGALGVCAGAGYTLVAAAHDERIRAVVVTAAWLHDAEAVKLFYGGEAGVQAKRTAAQMAQKNYVENGVVEYVPAISTTDEAAAMYGPYDYYLNPERGAIPAWQADKFAVMSWEAWLTFDAMPSAKHVTVPTLMIHSDGAVLPAYAQRYFETLGSQAKALHWVETDLASPFHQFHFYDQPEEVNLAVDLASQWFAAQMPVGG